MDIDWLEVIFRLRRLWNIWAILLISAFVNLLTQVPWPDWQSKSSTLKISGILGILFLLVSGICSQVLFENLSAFLQAEKGAVSDAARLSRADRKLLFGTCLCIIVSAFLGISGWIIYRSC
jgi:hypothetical protein